MNNKITFGIMTFAIVASISGISTIILESGIQGVYAQGGGPGTPGGTPYGQIVNDLAQNQQSGPGNELSQSIQEYREKSGTGIGELRGNGQLSQDQGGYEHDTRSEVASGR